MNKLCRIAILALLPSTGMLAPASAGFKCGTDAGSKCSCVGADECKDLRKSGMCKAGLDCQVVTYPDESTTTVCTCDAARIVGPGSVDGIKPPGPVRPKLPQQTPTPPSGVQQ